MNHSTNIEPRTVDYDQTLVLAIELSNKSWVLAAQVPGFSQTRAKRTIKPDKNDLLAAINGYLTRATAAGLPVKRVIASYEAGWCGFWLARWLMAHDIEVHVIQPSSVPVDRRMRRAKSDGIDAELLLRTLLAWLRGEPRVCSMVPIPSEKTGIDQAIVKTARLTHNGHSIPGRHDHKRQHWLNQQKLTPPANGLSRPAAFRANRSYSIFIHGLLGRRMASPRYHHKVNTQPPRPYNSSASSMGLRYSSMELLKNTQCPRVRDSRRVGVP